MGCPCARVANTGSSFWTEDDTTAVGGGGEKKTYEWIEPGTVRDRGRPSLITASVFGQLINMISWLRIVCRRSRFIGFVGKFIKITDGARADIVSTRSPVSVESAGNFFYSSRNPE